MGLRIWKGPSLSESDTATGSNLLSDPPPHGLGD